jgi:hypothetical protein
LAGVYEEDKKGADTAVWLGAEREEAGQAPWLLDVSPAHEAMRALRAAGLLDEIVTTKEGLVVYPAGLTAVDEE